MDVNTIIEQIDSQIARLQLAKSALTVDVTEKSVRRKAKSSKTLAARNSKNRTLSAAARKKIATAQKKRWAAFHAAKAKK